MKQKLDESKPIYVQIKAYIEDSIMNDTMKSGERAPSTNELAKFYQINPATARQGMNELVAEGILVKQRGVGMFVTEDAKQLLMEKRTEQFYQHFIIPLRAEAEKLGISNEKMMEMLKKEEK